VKNVQNNWSLKGQEFDSPYPELGFYGSPNQNNVFIMPSKYTLMSISERPFFVVMIDEIEVVSIERIDNKIKNFDMIVIFKDYRRPVVNIDNIPKNDLDTIKVWLNDNDILFFEGGAINIKWDKYLK
jgi:nucleosome binding factor SPN SPT16 subunit